MNRSRWWHLAVVAVAVAIATLSLIGSDDTARRTAAVICSATLMALWFVIGRFADDSRVARWIFVPAIVVLCGIGSSFEPNFATAQTVVFPLLWTVSDGRVKGIAASFALAVSVGIGMSISLDSVSSAVVIELLSLVFSIGLGLWISSIAALSQERQRLLDELQATQQRLAALSRDAGVASERERLAREIHDTIAQDLTALVMLTEQLRRELRSADPAAADDRLTMVEESARTALAEARALVASSAPVDLDTDGIGAALDRLGQRFARETGVRVTVEARVPPSLGRDAEVVLLRVAQEGLANIRKHAGASEAAIEVSGDAATVGIRVSDDGRGFDSTAATDGFGLGGLRDRLSLVGGTFDVSSSPRGTAIVATLPITVTA